RCIELSPSVASRLLPGKEDRREIQYFEHKEAVYRRLGAGRTPLPSNSSPVTAGYMVFVQRAWKDGPSLLSLFGLCGWETLNWATYLARHRAEWLRDVVNGENSCFYMAEWNTAPYPRTADKGVRTDTISLPRPLTPDTVAEW